MKIAPSILSADFAALGEAVARVEAGGADQLHVDVMDGCFVPNLTIGPPVIESIRKRTRLPMDVHLIIVEPERYIETFVRAGADMLTVHVEACTHLDRILHQIKEAGAKAGVALNPATGPQAIEWVLDDRDLRGRRRQERHGGAPGQGGGDHAGGWIGHIRRPGSGPGCEGFAGCVGSIEVGLTFSPS